MSTHGPDGIPVTMLRPQLDGLPRHPLPAGFSMKPMEPADIPRWYEVQRDAEPFNATGERLFEEQFGSDEALIRQRCRLLMDGDEAAGCISAWFDDDFMGAPSGRIHWVAIRPAWQGRTLAKPLLAHAMELLARWHDRAYLSTQTRRIPAINLYLGFGFEPVIACDADREAWAVAAGELPAVNRFL